MAQITPQQQHQRITECLRVLVADIVQQFNGGHPGGAMGMIPIGIALWKYVLKFESKDPSYFNRDRFVLLNGHTCLFQYIFLHLTGYKNMTMDQLKLYHSRREDSQCPGHPEIEIPGIEITTGALGQGVANAVGMAIATKNLQLVYNREGHNVISNHTFCMMGDACAQEGVALEAISLAGHLGLNNLTLIYDNNQVTCDGSVGLTNSENTKLKFEACDWHVEEVDPDVSKLVEVLDKSRVSTKPTLIIVNTVIGAGTVVEGTSDAHGVAFGTEEVDRLHDKYQIPQKFYVPEWIYEYFQEPKSVAANWDELVVKYRQQYPEEGAELALRIKGQLTDDYKKYIPQTFSRSKTATRKSNGLVFNEMARHIKTFMVGTADLSPSVNMAWTDKVDFQNPSKSSVGDYSGRYIHYGVREHAMTSIANGIAAFNPGTFIPVTSTFLIFYLYGAPGVRYGALSNLQVIHVGTHDSIGIGEDGPTHHPIEVAALYRAMPNILFIRPCDSEEVAGAWLIAIDHKGPSIISSSRHAVTQFTTTRREMVKRGAYRLHSEPSAVINLISTGSEMEFAVQAQKLLKEKGIGANVISFPCQRLFEAQLLEYKKSLLGDFPSVVIEAYSSVGWERYAVAGINMKTFGKSLPGDAAYNYFGFNSEVIADKIETFYINWVKGDTWGFTDL